MRCRHADHLGHIERRAAGPEAPYLLVGISFFEAIFLPMPPDVVLAPMVLRRPERAWRYALICMLASVIGGCVSYGLGFYLADEANKLLAITGRHINLLQYQRWFAQFGVLIILVKGLLPLPYVIVAMASGLAKFSFWQFVVASVVTRGGRFALTAWLLKRYGPQIQERIEKNLVLAASVVVGLVVVVLLAVHFLT